MQPGFLCQMCSPTNAEAKSVNPMARGAMLPWPGLVTAVANTTCREKLDTHARIPLSEAAL